MHDVILASASPRRKALLERLNVAFEVYVPNIEECNDLYADPMQLVLENAKLKCWWTAEKFEDKLVLGSDTTVYLDGKIYNKPKDLLEAKQMLTELSGKKHTVLTAYSLKWKSKEIEINEVVASNVLFKNIGSHTIDQYHKIVNPLDKAGGYGIQKGHDLIIENYEGSYSNIMGLPLEKLSQDLAELGIIDAPMETRN